MKWHVLAKRVRLLLFPVLADVCCSLPWVILGVGFVMSLLATHTSGVHTDRSLITLTPVPPLRKCYLIDIHRRLTLVVRHCKVDFVPSVSGSNIQDFTI
ncbi:hypothetical protein FKM82_015845 [Ascaphus truei]